MKLAEWSLHVYRLPYVRDIQWVYAAESSGDYALLKIVADNGAIGIAEGVKTQGGIMDQVMREVEIECLPGDIPNSIDVDVTVMNFGDGPRSLRMRCTVA